MTSERKSRQFMGLRDTERSPRRLPGLVAGHIQSTWLFHQALHGTAPPKGLCISKTGSMSATVSHWEATVYTRVGMDPLQEAFGNIFQEKNQKWGVCGKQRLKPILP